MNVDTYALSEFVRRNFLILALISLGLIFLSIGLIQFFGEQQAEVTFIKGEDVEAETQASASLFVDVSGAVVNPGVYTLQENARVHDALIAAGGLADAADRDLIAKSINLAQKISDGMKLYIPKIGEGVPLRSDSIVSTENVSGKVNINSASESGLDTLPGVGPVTAQKIMSGRPYVSIEDLVTKQVLTQKQFDKLKDSVSVY